MATSELHPYRASDELAAALREHRKPYERFVDSVVAFDRAHPGHELLWKRSALDPHDDTTACGFRDGTDDVPDGLSRAKTREELRPKRTKAGERWQGVLDRMNYTRPLVGPVLRRFDVPCAVSAGAEGLSMRVAGTQWGDADVDGVLIYAFGPMTKPAPFGTAPLSEHLTPIPLSEFYAIKERLESEKDTAADGSGA